jgi:hypothetical protein
MTILTDHWLWKPTEDQVRLIGRALEDIGAPAAEMQRWADLVHDAVVACQVLEPQDQGASFAPVDIQASLDEVADGVAAIANGLTGLWQAWRATDPSSVQRHESLDQLHRLLLGTLSLRTMPPRIAQQIDASELANSMPSLSGPNFTNDWLVRWQAVARDMPDIQRLFDRSELARTSRPLDISLVAFVRQLGAIYKEVSGRAAAAPPRKGNLPKDWQGPFVRFVHQLWPLTGRTNIPTRASIERALNAGLRNHQPSEPG